MAPKAMLSPRLRMVAPPLVGKIAAPLEIAVVEVASNAANARNLRFMLLSLGIARCPRAICSWKATPHKRGVQLRVLTSARTRALRHTRVEFHEPRGAEVHSSRR